jgi:hypothetical protein
LKTLGERMTIDTNEKPLITFKEARSSIEQVKDLDMRMFLKAVYILGASPAEMEGKLTSGTSSYRKTHGIIYGPKGTDVSETTISLDLPEFNFDVVIDFLEQLKGKEFKADEFVENFSRKIPVALFAINMLKRGKDGTKAFREGKGFCSRIVALPMLDKFEPWTRELFDYFRNKQSDYVFPFCRTKVNDYISRKENVFKGKEYKIRRYILYSGVPDQSEWVFEHQTKLVMYGLRYLRNDELIEKYDFNLINIETYTGAKFRHQYRIPVQAEKSIAKLDWHSYINKLCNPNVSLM